MQITDSSSTVKVAVLFSAICCPMAPSSDGALVPGGWLMSARRQPVGYVTPASQSGAVSCGRTSGSQAGHACLGAMGWVSLDVSGLGTG